MYQLNDKIKELNPYKPISGEYKIRLDANESFLSIPDNLKNKLESALGDINFNRYPDPASSELCKAFASTYEIESKLVTAGNGSDELIFIITAAFLNRGDKILTVSPDFSMYNFYGEILGHDIIKLEKNSDLTIDIEKLIRLSNEEKAAMIIFSNPCNPTSLGIEKAQVRKLIKSTRSLVVLDEAYMDFWDQSLLNEAELYDNLIILRTSSKALGLASSRIGFAIANETLSNAIKAVKSPYNINTMSQAVATIILNDKQTKEASIEQIKSSARQLFFMIKELELDFPGKLYVYETRTNFVFIKIKNSNNLFEFLKDKGIIIRNFDGYIRITAGKDNENREVVSLIRAFLEGLS